ncbi:multidrug effflux MFS transporter [Agromyces soli]
MPTPASRLTPGLLAALGFIGAVGPFATDMYLSSFTAIASELQTDASWVQLTLAAFMVGMGTGQLVIGPLSDGRGRRPVLLVALVVFVLSGVALVFAPSIGVVIALRFVQGASGCAGIVIARAVAADLSTGAGAVRALSLIMVVGGVAPLVAPPVGALVATQWGWRGVFAALALVSLAMLALAWGVVPESLPPELRRRGGIGATLRGFGSLLREPAIASCVLAFGLGFGTMMSYISASPFVGQNVLGMSPLGYSFAFAAGAAALISANLLNSRIAPHVGAPRMLLVGIGLGLGASLALVLMAVTGTLSVPAFIACAFTATGGTGLIMSNASALALTRAPSHARGSVSALLGACQFAVGGLVAPLVGLWGEHTALPMAFVMLGTSTAATAAAFVARAAHR